MNSSKKIYSSLAIILIIIALSSCSQNNDNINNPDYYNQDYNLSYESEIVDITVLRVLGSRSNIELFNLAEILMANAWYESGRGKFELELSTFSQTWDDWDVDMVFERLNVMLMAGQGYDMFMMRVDDMSVSVNTHARFLTNIFSLIDQCLHRSRNDYFANAFNMFTIDERLYGFPLYFSFQYVAINANLPYRFINRFKEFDHISAEQLMCIYFELMDNYPAEFGHLTIANNSTFSPLYALLNRHANYFIDFENNISYLSDAGFVSFLEDVCQVHLLTTPGIFRVGRGLLSQYEMRTRAAQFAFNIVDYSATTINAFFPPENPYFVHYIPLSNRYGELIALSHHVFCFPAAGNSILAWEFMQHLQEAFVILQPVEGGTSILGMATPIARDLFNSYFESWLFPTINFNTGRIFDRFYEIRYQIDENVHDVLAQIYIYSQMPVASFTRIPSNFIVETITPLKQEIITAEEAATRLHNMVALWLIEE